MHSELGVRHTPVMGMGRGPQGLRMPWGEVLSLLQLQAAPLCIPECLPVSLQIHLLKTGLTLPPANL